MDASTLASAAVIKFWENDVLLSSWRLRQPALEKVQVNRAWFWLDTKVGSYVSYRNGPPTRTTLEDAAGNVLATFGGSAASFNHGQVLLTE